LGKELPVKKKSRKWGKELQAEKKLQFEKCSKEKCSKYEYSYTQ